MDQLKELNMGLIYAAADCDMERMAELVGKGADINYADERGMAPIHHTASCAREPKSERFKTLMWRKLRGEDADANAQGGRLMALEWLKAQGADVNAKDGDGRTPAHLAAAGGSVEVLAWLKAQGADISAKDGDGWTPANLAGFIGHVEALAWLKKEQEAERAAKNKGDCDW